MTTVSEQVGSPPLLVHLRPAIEMSDEQFDEFCRINRDLRIEMTAEGDLLIMPPTGGRTGHRNAKLIARFVVWSEQDKSGVVFDSSTGFTLPNGAKRSPDVSWVSRARLAQLTEEQKQKFLPLCPDFVLELRSASDRLEDLQMKMREYIEQGAQLGWLIDPEERRVHVYQADGTVEVLDDPESVAGAPVLANFTLDVRSVWEADF